MAAIEFDHVLYGSTDSCIKEFQKALIDAGHKIPSGATGMYGKETKKACAAFQRDQGWEGSGADGLPGPKTFAALKLKDGGHKGKGVESPVPGHKVTFPYGEKGDYEAGFHTGHDFAAAVGTAVVAVRAGTIAWSNGDGDAYGNWIGLNADNSRLYVYCHLSRRTVKKGEKVKAGEKLGEVGSSGNVTGPHLHFEDRPPGGGYGEVRKPRW
jgi:murein DD-endopeptidase MepM/ murein hydrolase activator NlpD